MKKIVSTIVALSSFAALATGCAYDTDSAATEASNSTSEELACANPDGTNAMIAGLAAAIGKELHRWEITKDFEIYRGYQNQEMLRLTNTGKAQCGGSCPGVDALLSYQDSRMDQQFIFPGGQRLSSWSYAARLTSGWKSQQTCDSRPANNHNANTCPAEVHYLTQLSSVPGGCAQIITFQHAKSNGGAPLQYADQLINKLLWAGGTQNPYLLFKATGTTVEIDPTWGSGNGDPVPVAAPGSCAAVCQMTSTTNIATQCCQCNGVNGKFKVSPLNPNSYSCK